MCTARRSFLVAVAMLVALVPLAGVSEASRSNPYPPGIRLIVSADQGLYSPRARAVLTAQGCIARQACVFTIFPPGVGRGRAVPIAGDRATTLTATADDAGTAVVVITTPDRLGSYLVEARRPDGLTAETRFTVARIPATGSNNEWPIRAGLIAIAAGAALLLVAGWRRRERPATPAA